MTDLEHRLRAALAAAAEPPPAGLLEGIRRRHRRHLLRLRAGGAGAAAVILVTGSLVAHGALAGPGNSGSGRSASAPAATGAGSGFGPLSTTGPATAAPGTVLRDCQSSNGGTLGRNWQRQSVQVGPVWFIYGRLANTHPTGKQLPSGKVSASAMVIAVKNGQTAVVTAAPRVAARFRFLSGFNNSDVYSLREGAPGLTLAGCPKQPADSGIPQSYAPGLTMFWQGYLTDLTGCVPLQVQARPGATPLPVLLRLAGGACQAG